MDGFDEAYAVTVPGFDWLVVGRKGSKWVADVDEFVIGGGQEAPLDWLRQ